LLADLVTAANTVNKPIALNKKVSYQ